VRPFSAVRSSFADLNRRTGHGECCNHSPYPIPWGLLSAFTETLAAWYGSCLLSLRLLFCAGIRSIFKTACIGLLTAPVSGTENHTMFDRAFSRCLVLPRSLLARCPRRPYFKHTGIYGNNHDPHRVTVLKICLDTDLFSDSVCLRISCKANRHIPFAVVKLMGHGSHGRNG